MIVDSWALLAITLNEADEPQFSKAMVDAPVLPALFKGDEFSQTDIEPALKD